MRLLVFHKRAGVGGVWDPLVRISDESCMSAIVIFEISLISCKHIPMSRDIHDPIVPLVPQT